MVPANSWTICRKSLSRSQIQRIFSEWSQKVKKIKPHVDEQLRCLVYNRLRAVPELHLPEQTLQVVASFASAYPALKAQALTHHKVAPVLEKSGARA